MNSDELVQTANTRAQLANVYRLCGLTWPILDFEEKRFRGNRTDTRQQAYVGDEASTRLNNAKAKLYLSASYNVMMTILIKKQQ